MSLFTSASAPNAGVEGARAPGRWYAAIGLVLLPGCAFERYSREPLEAQRVVSDLVVERQSLSFHFAEADGEVLRLTTAAELLLQRNPDLRITRAAYERAAAAAAHDTPFPNPVLTLGPEFGFGPDAASPYVVPIVRLGFTIPTAGKRSKQDAVAQAHAELLNVDYATRCGELYLELRRRYVSLAVARARATLQQEIVVAAAQTLEAARRLVEAGGAQALDVSLFRLEHARERSRDFEAQHAVAEAEADLAGLIAIQAAALGSLPPRVMPSLPEHGRDLTSLRSKLFETHPGLLRAEADYELAECELRLEIAKQYPDLILGTGVKGEVGEELGLAELALGFALPLFDRNQREIARATGRRVETQVKFRAEADRALGQLERAHRSAMIAEARRAALIDEVLPAARVNVEVAYSALPAGSADALQVLDAERSLRQVELEVLESELELQLAWSDLERAFGAPLLVFDESNDDEQGAANGAGGMQ